MNLKIEKGIPLPVMYKGKPRLYPFPDMEVGDSFEVVFDHLTNASPASARNAAQTYKRNHPGWDYAARKTGVGVVRIWRTA